MADLISDAEATEQVAGWAALPAGQRSTLISAASRAVQTYCRRDFVATDYDERATSDATGRLFLRQRPIISIAEIAFGPDSGPTVIPAGSYLFDADSAEVRASSSGDFWPEDWAWSGGWPMAWPGGGAWRDVRIRYRAGFELADIPADVKLATILTVRSLLGGVARDPTVSSQSQGGRSVSYTAGAQQTLMGGGLVADLLGQWRSYR
jgi:hypothetical protein